MYVLHNNSKTKNTTTQPIYIQKTQPIHICRCMYVYMCVYINIYLFIYLFNPAYEIDICLVTAVFYGFSGCKCLTQEKKWEVFGRGRSGQHGPFWCLS